MLRWLLRGLVLTGDDSSQDGLHARLVGLLERGRAELDGAGSPTTPVGPTLEELPALLHGQELAAVRLWVAALSADLLSSSRDEVARG